MAYDAGDPANNARAAIDNQSVDDQYVADLPAELTDTPCAAGEYRLVEIIGVILVNQQLVDGR